MTLQQLRAQIRTRSFHPLYYFYGEEDFLIERESRALAQAALSGGDASFNMHVFWAGESTAEEIISAANAFPFLSERRIVIVHDADRLLLSNTAAAYIQNPAPDTVLILTAAALPKSAKRRASGAPKKDKTDLVAYMKSPQNACGADVTVEFKRLRTNEMATWIAAEFSKLGKAIAPATVEKIHLAFPDATEVNEDDIFALLGTSKQYSVFQLADAVFSRNLAKAMAILSVMMTSQTPTLIVFQLAKQFTLLWQVRSLPESKGRSTDELARSVGLAFGWQMDELKKFQGNYRYPAEYERLFEYLLAADVELKSLPTDPSVILSRLLYQMTAPNR